MLPFPTESQLNVATAAQKQRATPHTSSAGQTSSSVRIENVDPKSRETSRRAFPNFGLNCGLRARVKVVPSHKKIARGQGHLAGDPEPAEKPRASASERKPSSRLQSEMQTALGTRVSRFQASTKEKPQRRSS